MPYPSPFFNDAHPHAVYLTLLWLQLTEDETLFSTLCYHSPQAMKINIPWDVMP
jgi:hypothetical protein